MLFLDSDFCRDVLPERNDRSALRGIFADGKETISNFSVAFRTKVCFNKKRQMEWNGEGRDCGMLKIAVVEDQQEVRDELRRVTQNEMLCDWSMVWQQ